MAGIPGKGGAKGRSGAKPKDDSMELYSVRVPADVKAALTERGSAAVRDLLIAAVR